MRTTESSKEWSPRTTRGGCSACSGIPRNSPDHPKSGIAGSFVRSRKSCWSLPPRAERALLSARELPARLVLDLAHEALGRGDVRKEQGVTHGVECRPKPPEVIGGGRVERRQA